MRSERFTELQEAIEEIVSQLGTVSIDPQERKALLRQLRILIDELDLTVSEQPSE